MSFTTTLLPILAVLSGAEQFLKLSPQWQAVNHKQEQLLTYLPSKERQLSKLSDNELKTIASRDHNEINQFLKDNGFDIKLDPFESRNEFGFAAILNILIEWKHEGDISLIEYHDQKFPAVSMDEGNFDVFQSNLYKESILKLDSKNGNIVYMTIADKCLDSFELLEYVKALSKMPKKNITDEFSEAIFPMVNIDLSWLLKLKTVPVQPLTGIDWAEIIQAKQQTKFQMNEKGACVESAVAIDVDITTSILDDEEKKILKIDKPFYLWIERPGINIPIIAAYIDTNDWQMPDSL